MNIFSLLAVLCFIINLYLGLHVFFLDRKSRTNRIFFFLCFVQILWGLGGILMYPAEDKEAVLKILDAGWFVVIPYMALVLHFCLEITKIIKIKSRYYLILYIPVLIFLYGSQTSFLLYKDVIRADGYWAFILSVDSVWSYLYVIVRHEVA